MENSQEISLYKICVISVAENIELFRGELKHFPIQHVCDVYQQVFKTFLFVIVYIEKSSRGSYNFKYMFAVYS